MTPSTDPLLELFARYNEAFWPGQFVAYALAALVAALLVWRPGVRSDRLVGGLLAGWWVWLGLAFQWGYARQIDATLGAVYAVLFVLQAGLFLRVTARRELRFARRGGVRSWFGWAAIGYALVAYPLIGTALGHGYPELPLFGLFPCPTTIVTFGLLLLAAPRVPRHVLAIPLFWAIVAPLAAVGRGVWEDVALAVVGVAGLVVILAEERTAQRTERIGRVAPADTRQASAASANRAG
jgi:hypothetical protein